MIILKMTWEKKSGARDMSAEGEMRMSYYRDREEWLLFLGPSPLLHPWKWDNANLEKYVREILERNTKGECHITERRLITFSGTIARHPALQYLHGTETACSQSFNFTSFILQVICETFLHSVFSNGLPESLCGFELYLFYCHFKYAPVALPVIEFIGIL